MTLTTRLTTRLTVAVVAAAATFAVLAGTYAEMLERALPVHFV